jgi:hypothetical protein
MDIQRDWPNLFRIDANRDCDTVYSSTSNIDTYWRRDRYAERDANCNADRGRDANHQLSQRLCRFYR